jgi:Domain of unknown function (DUF4397)
MNQSNTRFLSFAGLSLIVALAPLACGGDDDDENPGTAGRGGSSNAGTSNGGGGTKNTGGSNNTGGTGNGGEGANGGSLNVGGDVNGAGSDQGGAGGEGAVEKTRLRVVHASPNAPAVDVYVAGTSEAAIENLAYGNATAFLEVDAGTLSFDLRAAGAEASDDPAFTTEEVTLEAGEEYTLVAAGDFANADDEDTGFRILPLQHDFDAPEAGTALVRVVHATSAWEDVDLDLASTDDVDVPGLSRFGSESNIAIPTTAAQDVSFSSADSVVSELVLPRLTSESELFVIATGNPGFPFRAPANGFALLVVDEDGKTSWVKENPWVHALHSSDIGTVDIYQSAAPTARLANDVEGGALAAFQLKASTTGYTLKAVDSGAANGSASGLATGGTSTLRLGEHYLAYIAGATINTIQEQFDLEQPEVALLRGVHAVKPGQISAQLDFGAVTSTSLSSALITSVAPAGASSAAGVAVDPGNVLLGAAAADTVTPLFATIDLSGEAALREGERSFVLLTGPTAAAAKLYVVDTSVAGWSVR